MSPRRSAARSPISPSRAATKSRPGNYCLRLERGSEADAVRQAEKNLAQAQSQLDDLTKGKRPTEIASLEAQLDHAKANLKMASDELARREQLGGPT